MKTCTILVCTVCILVTLVNSAAIYPRSLITVADLAKLDRSELDYLEELVRTKRSGDILSGLKTKLGQGIKSKLGLFSHGSSHSYGPPPEHHYDSHELPESYTKMSFDFWTLKKSIFNTLLQAAKAIKGGIIALKGQLIKGSGSLLSAKGRLISAKGEAITTIGKHIATSAKLTPHSAPSGPAHEYGPPEEYGPPSGHGHEQFASHSAPGVEYGPPPSYSHGYLPQKHHPYEARHKPPHGIIILKKIPTSFAHEVHHHEIHHESKPSLPKPASTAFKNLLGKLFASSAQSVASVAGHASSAVVHGAASLTSHVAKSVAAGSAASSASLSSSKEHKHQPLHHDEHYADPHEHGFFYDESHSSDHNSKEHDSYPDTSHSHPGFPSQDDDILSTLATLSESPESIPPSYEPPTDSYGAPLIDPTSELLKNSVSGDKPASFEALNSDTYNFFSGANQNLAKFPSNVAATYNPPSAAPLQIPSTFGHSFNSKPQVYFRLNVPLDTNNFNTYGGPLNYGNNYNLGNINSLPPTKPISFDANNPELFKLLGPTTLTDPAKPTGFLPTPVTNFENPGLLNSDSLYSASFTNAKKNQVMRSPLLQKPPGFDVLKSVGYEFGPHGPTKF